jgi:Cdc6-like AAA superfamily ATPase
MYDIIRQRAEYGLTEGSWTDQIIHEATQHAITAGDVRQGIKLVESAASRAKDKLTLEDLEAAIDDGAVLTTREDINNLSIIDRLFVLAAVLLIKKNPKLQDLGAESHGVELLWERLCRAHDVVPPASRSTRYVMRAFLDKEAGMIENIYHAFRVPTDDGQGRRGASTMIRLRNNPAIMFRAMKKAEWGEYGDDPQFRKFFEV